MRKWWRRPWRPVGEAQDEGGTAFVAELYDGYDIGRLSARFVVHWESADGQESVDGPEGVLAEEAIAWARERAGRVLVQVGHGGDGWYSAGEVDLTHDGSDDDGGPIAEWPDGGLQLAARPVQSALDGSEQVVLWRIHCVLDLGARERRAVVAQLLDDDLIVRVEESRWPRRSLDVIVRSSGFHEVVPRLYRLLVRVLDERGHGPDLVRRLQAESSDWRVLD
jgi:hypothetical protein